MRAYIVVFALLLQMLPAASLELSAYTHINRIQVGMRYEQVYNLTGGPDEGVLPQDILNKWVFDPPRKGLSSIKFEDFNVVEISGTRLNFAVVDDNARCPLSALEAGDGIENAQKLGLPSPSSTDESHSYWQVTIGGEPYTLIIEHANRTIKSITLSKTLPKS